LQAPAVGQGAGVDPGEADPITRSMTVRLASSSLPATGTARRCAAGRSGWLSSSSRWKKTRLKAFTTVAPGSSEASSSDEVI
jgi:hypothetical protein